MAREPEILPPAHRDTGRDAVTTPSTAQVMVTGWGAERRARAMRRIGDSYDATGEALRARARMISEFMALQKVNLALEALPVTLAHDRADQQEQRARTLTVRAHREEVDSITREAEQTEAKAARVEANRKLFNAEQGLENQQRLKELNLEMWQKRRQGQSLEADQMAAILRTGSEAPPTDPLTQLKHLHAKLTATVDRRTAEGDYAGAARERLLAEQIKKLLELFQPPPPEPQP